MKEHYERAFKKINFIIFFNPVPFNRQSYQKQKRSGTSHQLLFKSQNKFWKIPLFVIYYLTKFDDKMQSSFWVIPKNYICKFMQVNSWHHKLFHFHLSFWIWKVWKEREKREDNFCNYLLKLRPINFCLYRKKTINNFLT